MLALARNKFVTRLPLPLRLQLQRLQTTHAFRVKRYLGEDIMLRFCSGGRYNVTVLQWGKI